MCAPATCTVDSPDAASPPDAARSTTTWITRKAETHLCNLACLCKRHHVLKTETAWTDEQQPDGSIVWISPSGRRTTDPPERRVAFAPDPDPPPF